MNKKLQNGLIVFGGLLSLLSVVLMTVFFEKSMHGDQELRKKYDTLSKYMAFLTFIGFIIGSLAYAKGKLY
jgi:hypothetical protein